jgi:hypothetical protein
MGWWEDLKVSLGFKPTPVPPTKDLAQDVEACFQMHPHPSSSVTEAAKATDEEVQFKQPDQPQPPLELTEKLPAEEPKVAPQPKLFKETKAKRPSTPKSSAGTKSKNLGTATKRQTKKVTK